MMMVPKFSQVKFSYNVHKDKKLCSYNIKIVLYGTETLSYLETKIWNLVLCKIKDSETLEILKRKKLKVKRNKNKNLKRKPERYPCKLCNFYRKPRFC